MFVPSVVACFLFANSNFVTCLYTDPELDLVSGTSLLTFAPNDVMMTIEIKVLDDNIVEATEDHLILLRVPEGETGVNLLQDSIIIRVEDDDCELGYKNDF